MKQSNLILKTLTLHRWWSKCWTYLDSSIHIFWKRLNTRIMVFDPRPKSEPQELLISHHLRHTGCIAGFDGQKMCQETHRQVTGWLSCHLGLNLSRSNSIVRSSGPNADFWRIFLHIWLVILKPFAKYESTLQSSQKGRKKITCLNHR